jgi:hypothetical protein
MILTAMDLYEKTHEAIKPLIERASVDLQIEQSGEWYDLVIWNIIISFLVNVSANVVYDSLKERLQRRGHLEQHDIEVHIRELRETKVHVARSESPNSKESTANVLFSFLHQERVTETVDHISQVLIDAVTDTRNKR